MGRMTEYSGNLQEVCSHIDCEKEWPSIKESCKLLKRVKKERKLLGIARDKKCL